MNRDMESYESKLEHQFQRSGQRQAWLVGFWVGLAAYVMGWVVLVVLDTLLGLSAQSAFILTWLFRGVAVTSGCGAGYFFYRYVKREQGVASSE